MKILFVYGYGGNPDSTFCRLIREALASPTLHGIHYDVCCYEYPQQDCAKAKECLEEIIGREGIDLVIGSSLGAFITLALETDKPKIAINPCMRPSAVLPLLKPRQDHPEDVAPSPEMIATYLPFEEAVNNGAGHASNQVTGLFGCKDELLGAKYFKSFRAAYGNAKPMPGGHRGNKEAIPTIVSAIEEMRKVYIHTHRKLNITKTITAVEGDKNECECMPHIRLQGMALMGKTPSED